MDKIDNRYEIIQALGAGLSGEVFSVQDEAGKKALKFLKKVQFNVSRQEALENFKNEFSILTELNHPGIARILDFGFDPRNNKYYFTSELIEGRDFFKATEDKPIEQIEELAIQVLRALNYLHNRGIYHLDLKPQNILVDESQNQMIAKIIDFGLASFSSIRKRVGTPAYMAPEIILGGSLDGRTDLYSLGVVFYKALTRENPFAGAKLQETFENHKKLIPPKPSSLRPEIPPYWDQILLRLLEKLPSDRYAQASHVIRDINFLANKNYDIETMDTRVSYLPEKGDLVGRKKEMEIFKTLFEITFSEAKQERCQLLIVEGKMGTGKTRLFSEFKYHSQLSDIPVYTWEAYQEQKKQEPPFCLQVDDTEHVSPEEMNDFIREHANSRIMILWALEKAPVGWSHYEILSLAHFSKEELREYIVRVTGLENPPEKLVKEIFQRSEGNPLFVTELLRTLLANNLLLDASGRWASSTFEDIGINFEKIQVPKNIAGLLDAKYQELDYEKKKILEVMALFNRPINPETLRAMTGLESPQSSLLYLIKEDLIKRSDREHYYFFSNVLMRDTIYGALALETRRRMHDYASLFLKAHPTHEEEYLFHVGHGSDDGRAIFALKKLAQIYFEVQKGKEALFVLDEAWKRAKQMDVETQIDVEAHLAEAYERARNYRQAIAHYEHLKKIYDAESSAKDYLEKRIQIYEKLGGLYAKVDRYQNAHDLFDQALQWLDVVPDKKVRQMLIQNHIANVLMKSGNLDRAEEIFKKNRLIWENEFSLEEKKRVTNNWLADLLIMKKEYEQTMEVIERDLDFFERIKNDYLISRACYLKGDLFFKEMVNVTGPEKKFKKHQAILAFERSLNLAKNIDAQDMMLCAYNGIGNLHFHEAEYKDSSTFYERALAISRKQEDFATASFISLNLGNIYRIQRQFRDAYSYYIYTINTLEGLQNQTSTTLSLLLNCFIEIAETCQELDELEKAESYLDKAEELMREHQHLLVFEFSIWMQRAKLYFKQGHESLCRQSLVKAQHFVKEGWEREELKKFEEQFKSEDTFRRLELPDQSFSWDVRPVDDQSTKIPLRNLEALFQACQSLYLKHSVSELLKQVLEYAIKLAGAERGVLLQGETHFQIQATHLVDQVNPDFLNLIQSVSQKASKTGQVLRPGKNWSENLDRLDLPELLQIQSILCAPIRSNHKVLGVIYLDHLHDAEAFTHLSTRLIHVFCDQVGPIWENTRILEKFKESQKKMEKTLSNKEDELRVLEEHSQKLERSFSSDETTMKLESFSEISIDEDNYYNPSHTWEDYERMIIAQALKTNQWDKQRAASELEIAFSTLYKKIKEYGLEDKGNELYEDHFVYHHQSLKSYLPRIFKAALTYSQNHPYRAIERLRVSPSFFYKVMKKSPSAIP